MIFDTHCHLGFDRDDDHDDTEPDPREAGAQQPDPREAGIQQAVSRAASEGVTRMLTVGIDLAFSRRAQAIRRAVSNDVCEVLYAAGLHPNSADRLDAEFDGLRALCAEDDCAAVGETGLDYHWKRTTPSQQKRSLEAHLALARELDKPVIIHCRDAHTDTYDVLEAHPGVRGVIHCFSGGVAEARRALDAGYDVSFAGPLTYPKADALREAARFVPEDRIHVETDAPFLTPQPERGRANEPAYVVHTLRELARLRGMSFADAAALTMRNGCRLFDLATDRTARDEE